MVKKTKQSQSGTSFYGTYLTTTPNQLRKLFPGEDQGASGDDKCKMNFVLENESGDVITIYDWKEYRTLEDNERIEFHIGGHNFDVTEQAKREIENMLDKLG